MNRPAIILMLATAALLASVHMGNQDAAILAALSGSATAGVCDAATEVLVLTHGINRIMQLLLMTIVTLAASSALPAPRRHRPKT